MRSCASTWSRRVVWWRRSGTSLCRIRCTGWLRGVSTHAWWARSLAVLALGWALPWSRCLPPSSVLGAPEATRLSRPSLPRRAPGGLVRTRTADDAPPLLERLLEIFLCGCAWISVATTAGIALVLALETLAFFRDVAPSQLLLDSQWTPLFREKHFGLWPLIAGTLLTSGIAL